MTNGSAPIDTRVEIVTPENIAFQYRLAGPFRRLGAYILDVLIRVTVVFILFWVFLLATGFAGIPGFGFGIWLIVWFVMDWFYGGVFEAFWNGQTPGKHMLRLRVVSDEGQPINGLQAVLRNLLRTVDAMPLIQIELFQGAVIGLPSYQIGLLVSAISPRFQRLGDLAAGTMVIVEEPQRHYGMARVDEPEAIRLASEFPANLRISRGLARALSAYVQRRQTFPWQRRAEIAKHVGEPMRVKLGLPPGTSYDLLLCALYHRAFIADRVDEPAPISPFAGAGQPNEPVPVAAGNPWINVITPSEELRR
ncbi:MAG TPA: RDD family protein [Pirellulales bacterium]|nr:RDD family protein [Pirellulales bacterium]